MLIKPGAHGRKQLSKKSREAFSSAVSSRVRVNFGEIFASRGREKKIYIVFDNFCLTKIYTHTGGNSWANGLSRLFAQLCCFLSCGPGLSARIDYR